MYKITPLIFLIVLLNFSVFAQADKSASLRDFSGTWMLDEENSFRSSKDVDDFDAYTLIISQNEAEIKIVKTYSYKGKSSEYNINLFTDKRGEVNKYEIENYPREDVNLKSTTFAKKDKIFRAGICKPDSDVYPLKIKETYILSKDGKTLTLITEEEPIAGSLSKPSVFERNPTPELGRNPAVSDRVRISRSPRPRKFIFRKK